MSDTSDFAGSNGFAVSRSAEERTEIYSSFPSPGEIAHSEMLVKSWTVHYPAR